MKYTQNKGARPYSLPAEVLNGMTADSPADTSKPRLPVAWVRDYTLPGGKAGKAFATVHGASERSFKLRASGGYAGKCKFVGGWFGSADQTGRNITFVGPYQPTNFRISTDIRQT